jgi:hypothetical protein
MRKPRRNQHMSLRKCNKWLMLCGYGDKLTLSDYAVWIKDWLVQIQQNNHISDVQKKETVD